jgi:undecaprenyl-diphosphatase
MAVASRNWGEQAALGAIALGATGGFLAISRTIGGHRGNRFDRAVVHRFGRARSPITNALMRGVTFFGSAAGATIVSTLAFAWARKRQRPRLAWQIVWAGLGGASAELVFKRLFLRKRPTLLAHLERTQSTSFPSGHSMASSSIYLTLAFVASHTDELREYRAPLIAGAAAIAGAVAVTRVYLGVHWPTDALGGLALGTAWACAAEAAFDLA